jgi:glutathione S-transferase
MVWHQRLIDSVPAWRSTGEDLERRIAEIQSAAAARTRAA